MKIGFAGTPAMAIPSLDALRKDHEVKFVLTQAPAPTGRKRVLTPSAIQTYAEELGIPVLTPNRLKDNLEIHELLSELELDAIAVVAYGKLIPESLLSIPKYGWLNLHFSKLPKWRGASPVQGAMAAGDYESGVTVFQIEKGLDTGPIHLQRDFILDLTASSGEMLTELSFFGAEVFAESFQRLANAEDTFVTQVGEPSFSGLLTTKISQVNWTESAQTIRNKVNAYTPEPGSWTILDGTRIKLGKVQASPENHPEIQAGAIKLVDKEVHIGTGAGTIVLSTVVPAGKKEMTAVDWFRGIGNSSLIFNLGMENE
ncbi:MAG: methionyl-tRNA formyltransferase [Arcanobacterium sp.]|nr:methionyl-tRNA formyltransferase [Arcanobacterium sp.]